MKEIELHDLKRIAFNILVDFDRVCRINNITYSLAYGTLLGAIRHKGFIPWDDDIDIIMPRADYEKFISVRNELKEQYKFISVETAGHFTAPLAKIYDNTTLLQETHHNDRVDLGVYIDIMVFDYIPESHLAQKIIEKRAYISRKIWGFATYSPKTKLYLERVARRLALKANLGRRASLSMNSFAKKLKQSSNMCNLQYSVYGFQKDTFPASLVFDVVSTEFEGGNFLAFRNYDYFLKQWYGNYMELPPKEKQVTHHTYVVHYKDPFEV